MLPSRNLARLHVNESTASSAGMLVASFTCATNSKKAPLLGVDCGS
jgi:hypothetical protein